MTGVTPGAIAYPNGALSDSIVRASGELGLEVGFTIAPVKNRVPVNMPSPIALRLGRFTLHDEISIETQCRTYRSDLLLYNMFRAGYLKLLRRSSRPVDLEFRGPPGLVGKTVGLVEGLGSGNSVHGPRRSKRQAAAPGRSGGREQAAISSVSVAEFRWAGRWPAWNSEWPDTADHCAKN